MLVFFSWLSILLWLLWGSQWSSGGGEPVSREEIKLIANAFRKYYLFFRCEGFDKSDDLKHSSESDEWEKLFSLLLLSQKHNHHRFSTNTAHGRDLQSSSSPQDFSQNTSTRKVFKGQTETWVTSADQQPGRRDGSVQCYWRISVPQNHLDCLLKSNYFLKVLGSWLDDPSVCHRLTSTNHISSGRV